MAKHLKTAAFSVVRRPSTEAYTLYFFSLYVQFLQLSMMSFGPTTQRDTADPRWCEFRGREGWVGTVNTGNSQGRGKKPGPYYMIPGPRVKLPEGGKWSEMTLYGPLNFQVEYGISLLSWTLTLSLPKVINFKFLLQPHLKYYITQHEECLAAFHSLLRWEMIILTILPTSLIQFPLGRLGEIALFELGSERVHFVILKYFQWICRAKMTLFHFEKAQKQL